jgi:pimeloyl-ACP methyl ester carboxylesterase
MVAFAGGQLMKLTLLSVVILSFSALSFAQSNPLYVQFQAPMSPVKGALYKPDAGPAHVAVLVIHRTANFMSHPATTELSKRGFMVLGMNPHSDNNESTVDFESNALDIKSGIEFLRRQPGITKVLLFGHSGGGPATSFYQAVAEKGSAYCKGPNKMVECSDNLAGLPKADGIVFMDAHPGISINGLRSINPAVVNESDPHQIDRALDPFSAANGYNPDGPSHYSDDFKKRYFKAQADRMNRLIDVAKTRMQNMKVGRDAYPDDDIFLVPRGEGARLMELDMSIHHTTVNPQKLLKNDGTIVTQVIESVRKPARRLDMQNASFKGGTRMLTIRSFLSGSAIRATDSMDNIDWGSSNNSTDCALKSISVPVLITAMGGHYFVRDSEIHFEMAASRDKEFIVIEGAAHVGTPCVPCETTPGQYSNTVKNFFDYVAKWINARY